MLQVQVVSTIFNLLGDERMFHCALGGEIVVIQGLSDHFQRNYYGEDRDLYDKLLVFVVSYSCDYQANKIPNFRSTTS